ncbi:MAG TPA: hypothetical protein VFE32_06215 [Puia sp.]|jgi:hypothetical protein|nr:hypothetical protein [Puia sp.]
MMKGAANNYRYVYLVALLSIVYLAFLVSSAQPGVFFSSDGGIKYLVVKQLTEGHGFKYMYLPQPQWVQQIWSNGFFPFRPPFLYSSSNGYLFVFPPAFQIISSFFYAHFGNAGLYVIPVASTLLLWISVILLLRRCGIAPSRIAIGLFILVFCSPLTLYGATYWEHMTAILLLFSGLAFLVNPPSGSVAAIGMGLLSGLAAWFRPEAMMMNLLYGLALVYLFIKERQRTSILFLIGLAIGLGSFLLFNKIEFDSFFGIHSRQVLKDSVEGGVEVNPFRNLIANNLINARHYLFVLLILPVVYVLLRYRKPLSTRTILLVGIVLTYCILTPFIVPNDGGRQWGARYFLPLVTVVLIALLLIEKEWNLRPAVWLVTIVILFAAYSFQHNTYKGGIKTLVWENHHRISPDLNFLNQEPGKVVVVSFPYIAMELGYIFDDKYFFLAPDDSSLQKLLPQLRQQGVKQYTYIYDVRVPNVKPASLTDTIPNWPRDNGDFEFREYQIR